MQTPQTPFWRRTPPAVFPPLMGLFGIALGWHRAADVFAIGTGWSELILGATSLLFLFLSGSYLAKLIHRPAVILEDLRVLPGRAGLAALTLSVMLMAAGLVPLFPSAADFVLWLGIALHAALAVLVIRVLWSGPAEQRRVTPAWHLAFVGFIVIPLGAVPLGWEGLASYALAATLALASIIYGISLAQILRRATPPPLRPLLAIHLAPVSLFGTAAHLLGLPAVALVLAGLASALLAILLIRARYLTAAGFSPLWGAFTFPAASWCGLMLALAGDGAGAAFRVAGGVGLVAATLLTVWIVARVLRMWANGSLGQKTAAAVA